ncbi:MAG: sirohydrochlorin cobaltochelatase [Desulfovibrio sp.]|nr:sirohydrochlorin cobaltochelatase [Desulfovibrio sp.]
MRSFPSSLLSFALIFFLALAACARQQSSVNAVDAPQQGILLVAFGTSVPEAMQAMRDVDTAFKTAFPGQPVVWAYTSQIIRKKLAAEGRPVGGISDGLAMLASKGVRVVRVQSLHVMAGEEFSALERALLLDVKQHPQRFEAVFLGRPMLESREDAIALARAVLADAKDLRSKGEALVLMGHGQEHGRAGLTFEGARTVFHDADRKVFMATVEGARGIDELLAELKAAKVKKAVLEPLMLVAGDHARNDLAGEEEDSWASRLARAGIKTEAKLKGLGQIGGARDILVRHAKESTDNLMCEPRKQ